MSLGLQIGCATRSTSPHPEIYCTSEERAQGIKTSLLKESVPCGRSQLIHPRSLGQLSLRMVLKKSPIPDSEEAPGFHFLLHQVDGHAVEQIKVERDDDPFWSEVVFVKVREDKYWSDLDGDGYDEFAIFPFSPGSAVFGTARIYSLTPEGIKYFGEGRLAIESGGHILLDCLDCSQLNPEACRHCR